MSAVSALWVSALRLFVATMTALATVTALAVATVLRWRTTVGACLLLVLTSETAGLLAAMWLLSVVAAWRVV